MTASRTLRHIVGLDDRPSRIADATPVMIDSQNAYRTGVMALDGAEPALAPGAHFAPRAASAQVVNNGNGSEGTPYDIRAETGATGAEAAPIEGEPVVVKQFPKVAVEWRP